MYRLQPVIRVVATQTSGTISGTVSPDSARAEVFTVVLGDTVSTAADSSGAFRLMALPAGLYDVHIVPSEAFRDTTITDVAVTAAQDKNLGIIELRQ